MPVRVRSLCQARAFWSRLVGSWMGRHSMEPLQEPSGVASLDPPWRWPMADGNATAWRQQMRKATGLYVYATTRTYTDTGSQRWHLLPSGIVPVPSLQCLSSLPVLSLLSLVLSLDGRQKERDGAAAAATARRRAIKSAVDMPGKTKSDPAKFLPKIITPFWSPALTPLPNLCKGKEIWN